MQHPGLTENWNEKMKWSLTWTLQAASEKLGQMSATLSSMSLKTVSVSKQYPTHKSYHKTTSITNNYYYYTIVNASTEK